MANQQAATQIEDLAGAMGVTIPELYRFITALKIWTDKGMSFEEAVSANTRQMERFANNSVQLSRNLRRTAIDWFYEGR